MSHFEGDVSEEPELADDPWAAKATGITARQAVATVRLKNLRAGNDMRFSSASVSGSINLDQMERIAASADKAARAHSALHRLQSAQTNHSFFTLSQGLTEQNTFFNKLTD